MRSKVINARRLSMMSFWKYRLLLLIGFWLTSSWSMTAQDTTATPTEVTDEAPPAREEDKAAKTRVSLTGDQFTDERIVLNALLRAKVGSSYQKVPDRKMEFFFLNPEGEEVSLGHDITGLNGIASISVERSKLIIGADGSFNFLSRWAGDQLLEDSEGDLMLRPATLAMELSEADSQYIIKLKAAAIDADSLMPLAATPVAIYVKRMFSELKVAEGETDEFGVAELEFPRELYGDDQGKLEITAMIEETEAYGNLIAKESKAWGIPVSNAKQEIPRALWSPNPPAWMIITFFVLMGAVWIHYAIVIINLFRIKSHRPRSESVNG